MSEETTAKKDYPDDPWWIYLIPFVLIYLSGWFVLGFFPSPARCLSGAIYGAGYAAGFVVESVEDGYSAGKYAGGKDG